MFFTKNITAFERDCDLSGRLKLSAAMQYMEQASAEHLVSVGLPYQKLLDEDMVFLLTKSCIRIHEMPASGSFLTVGTAATEIRRSRFLREFYIDGEDGTRFVSSVTFWILFDPSSRKVLRPSFFKHQIPFITSMVEVDIIDLPIPDIHIGYDHEHIISATYSLIDKNQHVNNSRYADFICDILPIEIFQNQNLESVTILFKNEAILGDDISVSLSFLDDGGFFVCGKKADGSGCFEARIGVRA